MQSSSVIALLVCMGTVIPAADQSLTYDGSSTVYPIIIAAGERYAEVDPRFTLEAKPTGTTSGFRSLIARTSTINGASRPITAREMKAAADAKVGFVEIPIAYDALSVVTNPRNLWLQDLTLAELQALWNNGGPTTWKQVRASFPDTKITLYGAGGDSGTYDYFNEAIMGKDRKIRSDYIPSEDDHLLVQGISANANALGFMGMAYVLENAQTIRAIAIDSGKGPVMPSKQSILDGTYVPLSRPLFIYVTPDQLARSEVAGFIAWMIDNPSTIESVGYVALPPAMRAKVKERFQRRTTGSVFSTAAVGTTLVQAMGIEAAADEAKPAAVKPVPAPTAAVAGAVGATAVAAKPAPPAWNGPSAVQYQQDLERLRAAALDLARRSLEESATVEDLNRRTAELKAQADALAEAFKSAPRQPNSGLSLAEAAALSK